MKAQPLYSLEEQYLKLDTMLPSFMNTINLIRVNLLIACSEDGNLDSAKNRFLNFIQDTEMKALFSSILEVPEFKIATGVNKIQIIHTKFEKNYPMFEKAKNELRIMRLPIYTLNILDDYFYGNEDPTYKLSVLASMVMFGYILDDEFNSRKE